MPKRKTGRLMGKGGKYPPVADVEASRQNQEYKAIQRKKAKREERRAAARSEGSRA